jgi:hydroxymethylbilane synthase
MVERGGRGVFVKELEECLLQGAIDIAVHSLKDMPVDTCAGLKIGAITEREDVRDALISRSGATLKELPRGARIGTGSPRRAVQIRAVRPDIEISAVRGNVDTRFRKMASGEVDAIVVAAAALHRLGWAERITEYLDTEVCLPAAGQGALAAEIRSGEKELEELVGVLNHKATSQAVTAERAFLEGLGGGCKAPVAAYARVRAIELELEGMVSSSDGAMVIRDRQRGLAEAPTDVGYLLAARLLGTGAGRLLSESRNEKDW